MVNDKVQKLQQQSKNDGDDSDHHVEFAGGNVHLITTKESWEQKLEEARRDGKTVSIIGPPSHIGIISVKSLNWKDTGQ